MLINGTVVWAVWLPVAVAVAIFQVRARTGPWHMLGVLALTTHLFWMASVGFFPMPVGDDPGFSLSRVNLVPFRHFFESFNYLGPRQIIRQHGGNFLLLVPFTLVSPALWPRLRAWKWALAVGVGGSVAIELLQLVANAAVGVDYRSVDIDDVILNGAGALAGYALFLGVRASLGAFGRRRTVPESDSGASGPDGASGPGGAPG
ncbi:MAG: VanZ family protein [Thermoleophilia bacterium]|nr:VanZ family protein [Thermoleophilia bacterium]